MGHRKEIHGLVPAIPQISIAAVPTVVFIAIRAVTVTTLMILITSKSSAMPLTYCTGN